MKELKIMRLLLKIENGTLSVRKAALHQITDKAREIRSWSCARVFDYARFYSR